ncbi:hypothetical protein PBCV1_a116R [Paramecium bursaria Chlorella virus 1]|uniref:Uncharacterized protein n=1 Tax=Paramecium bursaria Chlorella virus 1 TaxID=10506 RepID=Q84437_PBCV1|nr:hypothetical protein PBCV1_a116R [Paramecium bursaria Chlorella virus 1]AAC96484.1 hypothetical protein [Paramecium bursaria Chlorella virus 1]
MRDSAIQMESQSLIANCPNVFFLQLHTESLGNIHLIIGSGLPGCPFQTISSSKEIAFSVTISKNMKTFMCSTFPKRQLRIS